MRAELEDERGEVGGRRPPIEGHPRGSATRHRARAAIADRATVLAQRDAFRQQRPPRFLHPGQADTVVVNDAGHGHCSASNKCFSARGLRKNCHIHQ